MQIGGRYYSDDKLRKIIKEKYNIANLTEMIPDKRNVIIKYVTA
ncbi:MULTISPECIES: hypothetical protein [Tissierellales]|jgi:hypothetical protein|nr:MULTISPECIES: hypothetical protein [Tissierellales]SCL83904.1 hypothetical protein PP176A_0561 [Sporanaerobacter sp. PP17-6a]